MKNTVDTYIKKFMAVHSEKRRFLYVMLVLAFLVALSVYWRLKYTGIAMTNQVYCGLEEHTHTDDCYENVLVCGLEEGEEVPFSDETLSGEALSAGVHVHTDECYEKVLICGLEEHTHTVDCLNESLLAETTETTEETTAPDGEETSAEAGSETTSEGETSSEAAAETSPDNPQASSGSSSDDSSENSDDSDAYDNEEADYDLPVLTGYPLTDFTAAAESQIGYTESRSDCTVSEDGLSLKGYTKYGDWYGSPYGNWDATFLSYCLDYAGISDEIFPKNSGSFAWYAELDSLGCYIEGTDYVPSPGDIVFFDTDDNGKPDRVGAVTNVDASSGRLTAVEGDFSDGSGADRVCQNLYYLTDSQITGYAYIPGEEDGTAAVFTAEDSGVTVRVTAPSSALPEGAELYILLYDETRSEYTAAGEAIGLDDSVTSMAALDIAFSLNGEKVEPTAAVDVAIDVSSLLPEEADLSTVSVTHLAETSEGIEPVLVADISDDTDGTIDTDAVTAQFTVDSFSSFTITWKNYDTSGTETVSITANSYLYRNGSTTTTSISGRAATLLTTLDSNASYNTVDLTSDNGELAVDGYKLETATVNLVQNGTTISVTDALSIGVSGNSADGYTYTVTTASGSVTYDNITSASVNLYYSSTSTTTDTELDPTSYDSTAKVYWDIFVADSSASIGYSGTNSTTGVSSVEMGAYGNTTSVTHENSNATSWSASTSTLGTYFPNAYAGSTAAASITEDGIIVITPEAGYYVTHVVIACAATTTGGSGGGSSGPGGQGGGGFGPGSQGGQSSSGGRNPYSCQTWSEDNAFDSLYSVSAGGVMTIDVSSLYFSHNGDDDDIYFILIMVSPVASPLYVQYDYGKILTYMGIDSNTYSGYFSSPDSWTDTTAGNDYGSTADGVLTDDTQYMYTYDTDPSEVADWTHYANSVTDEAKLEAANAGYCFTGWYTEYYYDVSVSTSGTSPYIYDENYVYTFGSDIYYTTTYSEGEQVSLPTHAKLIAQWEPVELTITKTVEGLSSDSFYSGETYTYEVTLQKYNETDEIWEDTSTTATFSITGDGTASVTISPAVPGTYRLAEDTTNIAILTGGTSSKYLTVSTDQFTITTDEILNGTTSFSGEITNIYSNGRTEPLPNTGGRGTLPYTAAALLIIAGFTAFLYKRT